MAGNKHKNGIICTFPGCDKTMRTQKFKLHFVKTHLKQGEVYTVEHRRRFEVARDDGNNSDTASGDGGLDQHNHMLVSSIHHDVRPHPHHVMLAAAAARPHTMTTMVGNETAPDEHDEDGGDAATLAAGSGQEQSTNLQQAATISPQSTVTSPSKMTVTDEQRLMANEELNRNNKRPAAAIDTSTSVETDGPADTDRGYDPSGAILVEFVELMDRRFKELMGKMGEMIEVHKELINVLKGSNLNQPSSMALASAAEIVMKKRKKTNTGNSDSIVV